MEQALKALEQNGRPRLLLVAALCAVAALLGFALLRPPAPAGEPAPTTAPATPTYDRQTLVETRLREQVERLIGTIVGSENVRAIVSAEIEPEQTRQVSETSAPGTNGTETITTRSRGQIRRLTVSVMVNGYLAESAEGLRYRPRSEAELARFTRLARGAVGFDALRGDSLTVETVRFAPTRTSPGVLGIPEDGLLPLARMGLAGFFALAALALILRTFARRAPAATPESAAVDAQQPAPTFEPFTADIALSPALRRAGEAVTTRPAVAAAVVRQWMSA